MAKTYKRLISKRTTKQMKSIAPWAIALAAVSGMIAALANRSTRGKKKEKTIESRPTYELRSDDEEKSELDGVSAGFSIPRPSGAV